MNKPMVEKVKFRGVEFTETADPEYTPGIGRGMLTWEIEKGLPALQWPYDAESPSSLESARERMRQFLLRIFPPDYPKPDPTSPNNMPTGTMPDLDGPGSF